MANNQLDGKIIIVTGAAGGLGRAMVEALVADGAKVAAVDIGTKRLEALTVIEGPGEVLPLAADLRDTDACAAIAARAIEALGGLHGVVNNAGIGLSSIRENYYVDNIKFWDVPDERWQAIFDVNVRAPFLISKGAMPHLLEQGWGRIVNVTTSMDTMIRRGWTPYGPSKGALEAQAACWSKDCEGSGVTVNVLVPGGPANTAMVPQASSPDRESMVQPEVMQAPIVWLMSDDSDGFNGNRLTGTGWDKKLPGHAAAEKAAAPAAWPGAGQQSVWPDLQPT
ncbi:MAG: SDR family NAD(P)-dependent oxidoreductase [Alphaproteobacteria bacterium]|nr:SDR family NAD(P)-dependent oxidoreductase [Alphaproteobacteria bacterium]